MQAQLRHESWDNWTFKEYMEEFRYREWGAADETTSFSHLLQECRRAIEQIGKAERERWKIERYWWHRTACVKIEEIFINERATIAWGWSHGETWKAFEVSTEGTFCHEQQLRWVSWRFFLCTENKSIDDFRLPVSQERWQNFIHFYDANTNINYRLRDLDINVHRGCSRHQFCFLITKIQCQIILADLIEAQNFTLLKSRVWNLAALLIHSLWK